MRKRQLALLMACNVILFVIANALMSLLPVYLAELGADTTVTGYFFSIIFVALAAGIVLTGWLTDRFQQRKRLIIIGSVGSIPMLWLLGQATDIPQLTLYMCINWFFVGVFTTSVNILAGLLASDDERGQVFGLLSSAVALGGVVSGFTSGPIVDRWGFTVLFNILTVISLTIPIIALFLEEAAKNTAKRSQSARRSFTFTTGFVLLFSASVLAFIVNSTGALARPLIMTNLQFDATAVSGAVAVGGLIGLPLPFLVGWLSDRIGRKPLMIICYLANALGLLVLLGAFAHWNFWLSMAFQFSMAASMAVGSALITDLVPSDSLGVSLSLFQASNSIGFVFGFAGTGIAMQQLGTETTLIVGSVLALISTALLLFIRAGGRKQALKQVITPSPAA